jgi:tyrosinase
MRIRKNLLKLDKRELQALNDGFEALVAVEGFGGYQHIAGVYGKPGQAYRPPAHLFLPWHRAYLLSFERVLERLWPGVNLAYWDWTEPVASIKGIPGRLRKVAYADKDQGVWLNQFCRAPIDCIGHEYLTERHPGKAADLKPLAEKVQQALAQNSFADFNSLMEEASDGFRGWVGGHMNDNDYAAYDPMFWFHHANVDRIWWQWQQAQPEATVPESLLDAVLEPFAVKVRDVLSADRLGYAYE